MAFQLLQINVDHPMTRAKPGYNPLQASAISLDPAAVLGIPGFLTSLSSPDWNSR